MKLKSGFINFNIAILSCIFCLLLLSASAFAWKLPLEVSTVSTDGKKVYNKLIIGIEEGATDGFDNIWDTKALDTDSDPENPLSMRAYLRNEFEDKDDSMRLWKDVKGDVPAGSATTWDIAVDSVTAGKSVVISWNIPPDLLDNGELLMLTDTSLSGGRSAQIDLSRETSYSYISEKDGTRNISVTLSKPTRQDNSGGGNRFGCGMIKPYNNDSDNPWDNAGTLFVLFLPVMLFRMMLLTRLRLSIIIGKLNQSITSLNL